MDCRSAQQVVSSTDRLLERVVDGLEPQPAAVVAVGMIAAVPGRIDRRIGCPAILIDQDTVRTFELGSQGEVVGGCYTHSHDNNIGRVLSTVVGEHGLDTTAA